MQFRGVFSAESLMVGGEGCLQDLSHYGCRMESDTALQPGTELELCFFYGSREAVPIRVELATVRWAKGHELGVKFLRLQSHEEARLRHVIAELLANYPVETCHSIHRRNEEMKRGLRFSRDNPDSCPPNPLSQSRAFPQTRVIGP